jgi:hypothetical protein
MIPVPLPALERHARLQLNEECRALVMGVSAATVRAPWAADAGEQLFLLRCDRGARAHVQRREGSAAGLRGDRLGCYPLFVREGTLVRHCRRAEVNARL